MTVTNTPISVSTGRCVPEHDDLRVRKGGLHRSGVGDLNWSLRTTIRTVQLHPRHLGQAMLQVPVAGVA
jgi:hypothetical protein